MILPNGVLSVIGTTGWNVPRRKTRFCFWPCARPPRVPSIAAAAREPSEPINSRRRMCPPSAALFQLHADALGAIQQPPEMKARQRVVGMQSDQGGKSRHRRRVARLEFCKSFGILRGRLALEAFGRQRLEGAQRLAASAQHEITDRPALKPCDAVGDRGADANSGAEMLVGRLEPRRGVDGVAIGGVVEETAAAEIADQ